MNIHEIDWRFGPTREILRALSTGIASIEQEIDDPDEYNDYIDNLCGIAFVTTQVYIVGVVSDVAAIMDDRPAPTKRDLLGVSTKPLVADTQLTRMQLCDTVANYYKHRDEWSDWSHVTGRARRTIDSLRRAGFEETDTQLCTTAACLLLGTDYVQDITPVLEILSEWRQHVISSCRR